MRLNSKSQSGFTLIEMLIVIVVLGILAMIIIPQITVSTEDAKLSTLQTNLSGMRSSIEVYYAQHNSTYPGKKKETDGTDTGSPAEAQDAFIAQLILYSKADGVTNNVKDATYKFGPYVKGPAMPKNPFTTTADVAVDYTTADITTRTISGTEAWKFYAITGVFIANDSAAHAVY